MASRTNHKKTSAVFVIYTAIAIALSFPSFTLASTYDDYLLATEKVGETLGEGIKGGVEDTKELYRNAWNELPSLSFKTPSVSLPKVGPSLDSYAEYSNDLGQTFADTLTQGMGASQNLSQKIWSTDPYGHLTANVADVWNSTTNYFSNLFKSSPPLAPQPVTPKVVTPVAQSKPATPKPTPTPVTQPKITTPQTPKPTTTATPVIQPTQIITQRVLSGITSADLELKIQQLRNELVSKIGQVAGQSQSNYSNNFAAIALTNKIDQLTNTVLTTPTITGGSITNVTISGGSISGTTISGTTLTVSSGTFSGNLTVSGTDTSTFAGDSNFDTDTLYVDSLNNRVGVGTTSPSDTLALAGPLYLSQISAPSVTTNRLYNVAGALTWNGTALGAGGGGSSSWATTTSQVAGRLVNYSLNTTDIVAIGSSSTTTAPFFFDPNTTTGYISGNVGIGTTSPYAKLSVVGEAVAANFTATSTTATTTLAGGFAVETSGLVYDYSSNKVGIGTAAPTAPLSLNRSTAVGSGGTIYGGTQTNLSLTGVLASSGTIYGHYTSIDGSGCTACANSYEYGNYVTFPTDGSSGMGRYGSYINIVPTGGGNLGINTAYFAQLPGSSASAAAYQANTGSGFTGKLLDLKINSVSALILDSSGNLGIGTTSPYAKLSVVGETVSSYFTATSTTATSTLQGTILAASGGNVGIGTTSPTLAKLSVGGTLLASGHAAFGNESSINTTDWYWGTANSILSVKENSAGSLGRPITGIYAEAIRTPDPAIASSGNVIGVAGLGRLEGSPAIWSDSVYGAMFVGTNNSSFTVANIYGVQGEAYVAGTGGITNAYGGYFGVTDGGGGGVINKSYGVGVANVAVSGTNTYGVHVAAQTGGGVNSYAFYSAGTNDKSYFAGKIGIGTTTPNNKLDIYSTTKSAIGFSGASGDTYKWTIGMDVTNGGRFSIASSTALGTLDRFVINGDGNVGIGTTSPYAKLSVVGEAVASYFTATSTTATTTLNGGFVVGTGASPSGLVYDRSTGFVGIGTAAPQTALQVRSNADGNLWVRNAADFGGYTGLALVSYSDGIAPRDLLLSGNNVRLLQSGTEVLTMASTGNIGIGTTSPNSKLTIQGTSGATGNIFNVASSTGSSFFSVAPSGATTINSGSMNTSYATGALTVSATRLDTGSSGADYQTPTRAFNAGLTVTPSSDGGDSYAASFSQLAYTGSVANSGPIMASDNYLTYNSSATTTTAIGSYSQIYSINGGINSAYGALNKVDLFVSPGYINNAYGTYSQVIRTASGTINNGYGVYINTGTTGITNPYALYTNGTAKSYFGGNVGIGTTSPSEGLHIGSAASGKNVRVANGWFCVDDNDTCTGATTAGTVYAVGAYTTGADLAENYQAFEEGLTPGDIVSIADTQTISTTTKDSFGVKKATPGKTVIGIVSTKPGLLLANSLLENIPVALQGRVPLKVNGEGGSISVGDRITLSSTPGIGQKATSSSYTIAIALERFSGTTQGDTGTITAFINLSWSKLDPAITDGTILSGTGESSFWSVEDITGRIKFISQGIDLNDQDIVSVRSIIGSAGKWSIDASGRLVVGEVEANKVTTKTLCIDDVCIEKEALRALLEKNGVTQSATVINNTQPTPEPVLPPPAEGEVVTEPKPEETSSPSVVTPAHEPEIIQIQEPEPALAPESTTESVPSVDSAPTIDPATE